MRYLFFISLFFVSVVLHAQTLEEADALYAAKKYVAAAEMYEQLYRFDRAAESCKMQISLLEKSIKNKKKVQAVISDSIKYLSKKTTGLEKLENMVRRCEDIQIIDSIIVDKNDFLNVYHISEDAGTLAKTQNSVIYENQLKNRRFYAKQSDKNRFRLYTQVKIQGGWSEEKPLNMSVDSLEDDNYPFVMADGLTIYYASTGNESIGGYDLFVSRYNIDNDAYLAPEQLGMPFNSTYNDYMMVIDELNNIGYFATDRFLPEDQVIIYTFIPNEYPLFIEDDDFAVLSSRAGINSIRDTWRKGINYQALLQKIKKDIEKKRQPTIKKDFTFVINDKIVYYTLADFDDDGAKQTFLRSQDLQKQISTLENQLEMQRRNYTEGDANRKQILKLSILEKESQLENLYDMFGKTEIEARNREISKLRIKN
ncbi:MAG: tetratricopeptide repeat protein [Dysgonamonadaceae bacterium]|nr:tetratricopeptide repeat protein [Dysgonamonadaceae bacterium]